MDNGSDDYRHFLEGDKEALVRILTEYNDGLVLFLNKLVCDICLSEEIAEDVFCELLLKKPEYNGKSSFKTWLYAIAKHHASKKLKYRSRFSNIPFDEHYELTDEVSIEANHIRNEHKIILHQALKRIKPEYSQVIYLTFFEGFTNSETAQIMNKSNRQIENLVYRAKKALKKELEREEFTYENIWRNRRKYY